MGGVTIRQANGEADLAAVRDLCRAYRALLADRTQDKPEILAHYYAEDAYEALLRALPEKHARPKGTIFVAELSGRVVGCGMTHEIAPGVCEIKRVFVEDAARGHGAAKTLCLAAMAQARADGFTTMMLDTMVRLPEAIALYETLGFRPGAPFYEVPEMLKGMILFFETPL